MGCPRSECGISRVEHSNNNVETAASQDAQAPWLGVSGVNLVQRLIGFEISRHLGFHGVARRDGQGRGVLPVYERGSEMRCP